MGNCPSSFRAEFRPPRDNCQTDIILSPATENEETKSCENMSKNDSGSEAGEDDVLHSTTTNGTPGTTVNDASENLVALKVEDVDLCVADNTVKHHTSNFNHTRRNPVLILRRGFAFRMQLKLNRPYQQEKDIVCIICAVKDAVSPSYVQGTQVILPLQQDEHSLTLDLWQAKIISSNDKLLTIEVKSSASAVVGKWTIEVDTKSRDDSSANGFKVKESMILLFNPWCESDSVYLSAPEHREEYVMCESGLLWRGTHSRMRQCAWNYAQFQENILDCSLYLLSHVGALSIVSRTDPVLVVRHLSAVMKSNGSTGVLVGNWSGNFKGGHAPTSWSGSHQILNMFYKSKKPVKYGQCWVYAGVLATVCRALGIPSRPITNYLSAHNTCGSMVVEHFYGDENKPNDSHTSGTIWSFHVWTEVWMQRSDLEPGGYGGWQVVDASAQQDGFSHCGPSSVFAIKRKEVKKPFDAPHLLAAVDAEKVYWKQCGPDEPTKLVKISTEETGQSISTKAVGKFEREDITQEYKEIEYDRNVKDARLFSLVQKKGALTRYSANKDFQDVQFSFSLPDDVIIGEAFAVKLKVSNRSEEKSYSLKVSLRVCSALYTGQEIVMVKRDAFEVTLSPNVEQEMTMSVNYSDYSKTLSDQCLFIASASARVVETGFDFFAQDDFRVRMPHISIQVGGEISQNHPLAVTMSFTNPLPKQLKNGAFMIDGPGLVKPVIQKLKGSAHPKGDVKVTCKVTLKSAGMKTLIAKFHSKELWDVEGYHVINVKPAADHTEKETNSHL